MSEEMHPLAKLLRDDPRYKIEAYQFVREGLDYAQEIMGFGADDETEGDREVSEDEKRRPARHVTGGQLSHALRKFAIDQYGLMAKLVLNSWGLRSTSDFGSIVYNLIEIGLMSKSKSDRREDFDNVFDFDTAFVADFVIGK